MSPRRKTGEPQKTRQPFNIDRLPRDVQESIELLKNRFGKTWEQIEAISALEPENPKHVPLGGFVLWSRLPPEILDIFPERRLSRSSLQRWYDVRVAQVKADVMHRAAQARELAEAFAKAAVDDGDEAVLNACRDVLMGVLAEDGSAKGRAGAAKQLISLAEVQQAARANAIKERKVAADERKLRMLEEREKRAIKKLEAEQERLQKKAKSGEPITVEDLDSITERTFGFRPVRS